MDNETIRRLALIVAERCTPGCNVEDETARVLDAYVRSVKYLQRKNVDTLELEGIKVL